MVVGQSEGETAFKAYTDFAVGGTWVTTVDGVTIESRYTRIPDSPFVQITNTGGPLPCVGMIGLDPRTKACTWWFFNNDGGIGKDVLTQESDKVFLLEGTGSGPKGTIRYKGRITQVDKNTVKEEVLQFSIGDEDLGVLTAIWKR
jgi:hypothetical protein